MGKSAEQADHALEVLNFGVLSFPAWGCPSSLRKPSWKSREGQAHRIATSG